MRQKMWYIEIVNSFNQGSGLSVPFLREVMNMSDKWWKCAGIRAVKTVAQTAIATIGTGVVISQVDWVAVVSASVLAGILSLLTSIAGLPEVDMEE